MKWKRSTIILFVAAALIIVVLLPVFMDHCIIGNSCPSNISNESWTSFFGSYFGGVIGAIGSMCGIIITILFTSQQNKENNATQIRPYCVVDYADIQETKSIINCIGKLIIKYNPTNSEVNTNTETVEGAIVVRNIGLGPAIKACISNEPILKSDHSNRISADYTPIINTTNVLQLGESAYFKVTFQISSEIISEDDIEKTVDQDGIIEFSPKQQLLDECKALDLEVELHYNDLFDNEFSQSVIFTGTESIRVDSVEGTGKKTCNFNLQKVANPIRIT